MKTERFCGILLGLALAAGLLTASPARAQITSLGASPLAASGVLGAFDYDDKHHVYFHVWEFQNRVWGRFIGSDGSVLGSSFIVSTAVAPAGFAGRPKVAYTRGSAADEFLVMYASDVNVVNRASNIFGQIVRYTGVGPTAGTIDGGYITLAPYFPNSTLLQVLDTVVFNPVTSRFLVVWEEAPAEYEVVARQVALDGSPVGAVWNVSEQAGSQGMSQAAYDSKKNQYLVTYVGDGGPGFPALGTFARTLDGTTGQPTSGIILLGGGYGVEVSAAFLPEREGFIVTWTAFKPDRTVLARFVPSTNPAALPEPGYLALDTPGGDGGASVTYDPASRVTLVAAMSDPKYIRATLLDANGVPQTPAFVLGTVPAATGSYYPTVTAAEGGVVGLIYVIDYSFAVLERFQLAGASTVAPPLRASLTSNTATPAMEGTAVTWTASVSGGKGPQTYQFWRFTSGVGWSMVQDYSSLRTYAWIPPAGTHAVQVFVRNSGSSERYDAYAETGMFSITPPRAKLTSLTANVSFPTAPNVPITFTAQASRGVAPLQYQFWRFTEGIGWAMVQDYSSYNTYTWYPNMGNHAVQVWVRGNGSTERYEDWGSSGIFAVASSPARIANLSSNRNFPASPNSPITFTATGKGGSGPLEYKFWLFSKSTGLWSVLKDWGVANQATWAPGLNTGMHALQVWVRTQGSGIAWEDWEGTDYFLITNSTALSLTPSLNLATYTVGQGCVLFTANASPTSGILWEYAFWTYTTTDPAWTLRQSYSSVYNTFNFCPLPGTHAVQVWVRQAGSNAAWERWEGTGYFVVRP